MGAATSAGDAELDDGLEGDGAAGVDDGADEEVWVSEAVAEALVDESESDGPEVEGAAEVGSADGSADDVVGGAGVSA